MGIKVADETVEKTGGNGPMPLTNFFKSAIVSRLVLMI